VTPDTYTIQETFLAVGDGHELYIHEWGNPKAHMPILFLHGGPGGETGDKHKRVFDPTSQRVIFFDQRGCGKSLPLGSIQHNTTQDQIGDIEKIANHLGLKNFVLTGGSWGCCLALAYAITHPKRVAGLVLNGIWTGTKEETNYVDQGGFRQFIPEVWERYVAATPKTHQADPSAYHFKRILGDDQAASKESGYTYENLEGALLKLDDRYHPEPIEDFDPTGVRIEVHYFVNHVFLPHRYILDNAYKLTMPVWLVQGRYDVVCPPVTAYELAKKLPQGQLIWTLNGHMADHESWNVQRTLLAQWN